MSAPRITATARLQRLLALLQWAAEHPEGTPVDALCERFRLTPAQLARELDLASMIGADSAHYDDMPFEVFIEDGLVFVRLFSFRRPMKLSPAEGLALVASANVLVAAQADQSDAPGPLERALAKLAALLDIEPGVNIEVELDLDPHGGPTGRLLRRGIEEDRVVAFTYWTYGRDEVAVRTVDPWHLHHEEDAWYLIGWAHDAEAVRTFRLDRMADVSLGEGPRTSEPPEDLAGSTVVSDHAPTVTLELAPSARWVAEVHPVLSAETLDDDSIRVTMAVGGASWLERLLLSLGSSVRVVDVDDELGGPDIVSAAATRVLRRYQP